MPHEVGRSLPISIPRLFITDLLHFAQKVPLCTMQRTMHLAPVAAARARLTPRPGWCALFTKAYAIVAAKRPSLRWVYIPWPRPHFYEHPCSIASIALERCWEDEDAIFFTHLRGPDNQSVTQIEEHLRHCKNDPIETIPIFRRMIYTTKLPRPLRRMLWRIGLYSSGARRARHLGTFGVSVTAALGAAGLRPLSPLTTNLSYGVIQPDSSLDVRVTYDHRVLDGGAVARALADLEEVLTGQILAELHSMAAAGSADQLWYRVEPAAAA
jgi:hypothetical protein